MNIEEVVCTYCNESIKVNVPDGLQIIKVERECQGSSENVHPYGCASCGETNLVWILRVE